MKITMCILGVALALLLSGCVLSAKQQPKASAVPPPPKSPAATPASSASTPQAPLSIPQTVAELPAPQPITEEALQSIPKAAEEPVEAQAGPRPPPRRGPVQGPPRAEAAATVPAQTAPTTPTPPAPEEVLRAPITEILPEAEMKRLQDSVATRKRDIRKVLDQTDPKRLSPAQKDLEARIRTLVQLSDEAGTRNDWRQADNLAGQALTLVRELQGGR